jgi:hypothetical protein
MKTKYRTKFASEKERFEYWINKTPNERIEAFCEMYHEWRSGLEASLPKGLSKKEKTKQLYFLMYGEELPSDFFRI